MLSGAVRIASCVVLAALVAACDGSGPPAPVTYRVEQPPPSSAYAPRPVQRTPPATPGNVVRQPEPPATPGYVVRPSEPPPASSGYRRQPEPAPATPGYVVRPQAPPSVAAAPPPAVRPQEPPPQRAVPSDTAVVVGPGETLYAVARRSNVPLRSLIEANNLQPPYRLDAGRRLVLPQVREYVTQQGDTVASVSRRFGVDSSTLASTNNLQAPYAVQSGAPLLLPPPVQTTAPGSRQLPPVETPRGTPVPPQQAAPPLPEPAASETARGSASATPPPPAPAVVASLPPTVPAPPPSVVAPVVNPPPPVTEPAPPPATGGKGFRSPVRGTLLAGYGPGPNGTQNDGINIAAPQGTPIVAVADGEVKYAGNELRGFGNLILIKHDNGGWIAAYAHCDTLLVKRGDHVRAGQEIAKVGATGDVGAPQLHFELRRGTRAVDPTSYLPPIATP